MSDEQMHQPEEFVGVWRRSVWTWGFLWRTVITLTLYVWLLWRRNQITVTTRRISQRRGNILGGSETSLSIENVTDVTVNVSALGAVFGYGDIEVQSAGSSSAEIAFKGLGRARKLRDVVFDLKDGVADGAAQKAKNEG
ncbi:MAG: PH domain-containing protein [Anaerolineae bacterium]|nr:PH domain-containing protein [Anaerolineae bacterium]